jgi:hypothetical protein
MERERIGPAVASNYEIDHIIPLAIGGHPTDRQNFALQILEGENGAKGKDRIEVKLQCLVCSRQVTLADAQHQIATDWQAARSRQESLISTGGCSSRGVVIEARRASST